MSPIKSSVIMTTAKPERKVRQAILALLTIALLPSGLSQAQESDDPAGKEAPSWYQVEVVIFTQQGYAGNEQPPREVALEFHDNTVELLDPEESASHSFPLAAGVISTLNQPLIPYVEAQDPALAIADTQSPSAPDEYDLALANSEDAVYLANNLPANIAAVEQPYVAQYEPTFIKLPREARNLNESAAALDRQLQYNLLFHEAWRFQTQTEETEPWILIKAGQSLEGRYQIEGALRFYKSRFLHFEPNLWLLEFANDDSRLIELPKFPVKLELAETEIELSESIAAASMDDLGLPTAEDYERLVTNSPERPVTNSPERPVTNSPERPITKSPERSITKAPKYPLIEDDLIPLLVTEQAQPKQYPVSSVWVFNRSKRIDENEIYYLDHPQMGAIVTIKAYEAELLNPPIHLGDPAEPPLED